LTVDVEDDRPLRWSDLVGAQRHLPDRKEITEREPPTNRRFDVHDAVLGVRVNPVKARSVFDEWPLAALGDLPWLANANPERDLLFLTIDKDRQVDVHVHDRRLECVARNTVDVG